MFSYVLTQEFSTFILSFTPWQISKVKFTPQIFFILSFLQMPIAIGKSVNFCEQNLPPKGKFTSGWELLR